MEKLTDKPVTGSSRRSFLQKSAVAGAAATVGAGFLSNGLMAMAQLGPIARDFGLDKTQVVFLGIAGTTLVMAGSVDPLVPLLNAKLMHMLIPHSELKVFDCGHLFLITRAAESAQAINEFLGRP